MPGSRRRPVKLLKNQPTQREIARSRLSRMRLQEQQEEDLRIPKAEDPNAPLEDEKDKGFPFDDYPEDAVIHCKSGTLLCHKQILKDNCPVLAHAFDDPKVKDITMITLDKEVMKKLISYMYSSHLDINEKDAFEILEAARDLRMQSVVKMTKKYIMQSIASHNCLRILQYGKTKHATEFEGHAMKWMKEKFTEFSRTEYFLDASVDVLMELFPSDDLNVQNEAQVYEALIKWAKHDKKARRQVLPMLLAEVRLPLINPSYLEAKVKKDNLIRQNPAAMQIIAEAKKFLMLKDGQLPKMTMLNARMRKYHIDPKSSPAADGELVAVNLDETDELLLCIGGINVRRKEQALRVSAVECLDLGSNNWFKVGGIKIRASEAGYIAANGKLYVMGGVINGKIVNTCQVFDPETYNWSGIAPMLLARRDHKVVYLNGNIYALGGYVDDINKTEECERYDLELDKWFQIRPMSCAKGGIAVAAYQGELFVAGGRDQNGNNLSLIERYTPMSDCWQDTAHMKHPRFSCAVGFLKGLMYIIGGWNSEDGYIHATETFEPHERRLSEVLRIRRPRCNSSVAAYMGRMYLAGGENTEMAGFMDVQAEYYDTDANDWMGTENLKYPRWGCTLVVLKVTDAEGKKRMIANAATNTF